MAAFAARYDGGGHASAAGFDLACPIGEARQRVLRDLAGMMQAPSPGGRRYNSTK